MPLLRILLALAGLIAALLVARDAPNFEVVEGMIAIALITGALVALALVRRR